jgi:hypothetical protein
MTNGMSLRTRAAFGCYLIFAVLFGLGGIVYATASEIMPYHQQVTGMAWAELEPGVQVMFLGFIRVLGCLNFIAALSVGILLFGPFRKGEPWARWAIPALCLAVLVPHTATAFHLAAATGAPTPRALLVVFMLLAIAGFLLSEGGRPLHRGTGTRVASQP